MRDMKQVNEACADEIGRFNAVCRSREVRVNEPRAMSHGQRVLYVTLDFDLVTGERPFTRTWAYCNDASWAKLLAQNGVARNPLFAASAAVGVTPR